MGGRKEKRTDNEAGDTKRTQVVVHEHLGIEQGKDIASFLLFLLCSLLFLSLQSRGEGGGVRKKKREI